MNIPNTDGLADPPYPSATCDSDWSENLDDASLLAHTWDFSALPGSQTLTNFAIGLGLRFDVLIASRIMEALERRIPPRLTEDLEDAFDTIINSPGSPPLWRVPE